MSLRATVFVCLLVAVLGDRTFIAGPAGSAYGISPVPGYVLATLADISSNEFLSLYDALGLHVESSAANFPSTYCPFVAVENGFLATGSPLSVVPTVIAPFNSAGSLQDGLQLVSPFWMGVANATAFSTQNEFVGSFNKSFAEALFTISMDNLISSGISCDIAKAHVALYVKAKFSIGGFGEDFPHPPFPAAILASVDDLRSDSFLEVYNVDGLADSGETLSNNCCALRVSSGYLSLSTSTIQPYTASGSSECPTNALTAPVWLGTANNGAYPDEFIGSLNASTLADLTTFTAAPSGCSQSRNVWAIYKYHSVPPTPAPAKGDCYNVDIQVSYYLPGGTVCLAERFTYYMRLNETIATVHMSSINECGGTVGSVVANGIELQPYNESFLVGRTSGATNCDCSGVTNWGFVPLNESGYSYKSTLCYLPIQEFYFCEVLMELNNGPVQCPPSP